MCDYSLEHFASRPAKVGDKLITTIFNGSITRGFRGVGEDPTVAVCLRPGTELAFDKDVISDHALGFFPPKNIGAVHATFRQINPDRPHDHHDALEFSNGRMVLLTRLHDGQTATVLQLPVMQGTEPAEEQPAETPAQEPAPAQETPAVETREAETVR